MDLHLYDDGGVALQYQGACFLKEDARNSATQLHSLHGYQMHMMQYCTFLNGQLLSVHRYLHSKGRQFLSILCTFKEGCFNIS